MMLCSGCGLLRNSKIDINTMKRIKILGSLIAFAISGVTSCDDKESENAAANQQRPMTTVDVLVPEVKDVVVFNEYAGRTDATSTVDVIPRVGGLLEKKHFTSGQYVKKDQLLFTIDKEKYQAEIDKAEAVVQKSEANVELKTAAWQKLKKVYDRSKSVAEMDVLVADAEKKVAISELSSAKVALNDAKRDLRYTDVEAPISGRISKTTITVGNLVTAESTNLVTITQDDPVYFEFEISEREILPYLKKRPKQGHPLIDEQENNLELRLADGSTYDHLGKIDFIANGVEKGSGSYQVRAIFDNPEGGISGGLFARVGIPTMMKKAVLVDKAAILRDLSGYYVFTVNDENTVERKKVIPSAFDEGKLRILESYDEENETGLRGTERVVTSNIQKIGAGLPVNVAESKSR